MTYRIDTHTYDKAARWPAGIATTTGRKLYRGYEARLDRPSQVLRGLILHSTEHQPGQAPDAVWAYLRDSPAVSTHYGIGPDGAIVRVLDPGPWIAYHAGVSRGVFGPACNLYTVGVELFHRAGGPDYTAAQWGALAWLCRTLMRDHPTITRRGIQLHRAVALPPGRKIDPSGRDDTFWARWIAAL